jgi:hypothetical protein
MGRRIACLPLDLNLTAVDCFKIVCPRMTSHMGHRKTVQLEPTLVRPCNEPALYVSHRLVVSIRSSPFEPSLATGRVSLYATSANHIPKLISPKKIYSLRPILLFVNIDVSTTKICLDISTLRKSIMSRRKYRS